jgi:hypothetical protein
MKKHSFITKLAVALVATGVPLSVFANGNSLDKTATGSIGLSRPNQIQPAGNIQGGLSSNVAFRALVREGSGSKIITPAEAEAYTGALGIVERVSNKSIIEAALPGQSARGKTLVLLHEGNDGPKPRLAVYDRSTRALIAEVDDNIQGGVSIDFDWIDFVGVYRGSATVSRTVSNTSVLSRGSLRGFTGYDATLNITGNKIPMKGVGSFIQNVKGITGRANVSGVYVQP